MLYTYCPYCKTNRETPAKSCQSCGNELTVYPEVFEQLRQDARSLRHEFLSRLDALMRQVNEVENTISLIPAPPIPIPEVVNPPADSIPKVNEPKKETSVSARKIPPTSDMPQKHRLQSSPAPMPIWLKILAEPLARVWKYGQNTFEHYKSQQKLPAFFMTLGGIFALIFGFGYLLQMGIGFLIDHMSPALFEVGKITLSFASSTGIILWGIRLFKKGEIFKEFGSALLGLGIVLNYLIFYFLADSAIFPIFGTPWMGLTLIALNAVLGSWLALTFETRIVAVVSLLGAAFAPFYIKLSMTSPFYMAFLWMVSASSTFLAYRINWRPLLHITLLVGVFILEWIVFVHPEPSQLWAFTVVLHAFAYLFIGFSFFERSEFKQKLIAEDIILMAASIGLLILNLSYLYFEQSLVHVLGWLLLGNGSLWTAVFLLTREKLTDEMKRVFLLIAASFIGIAIPLLIDERLIGLSWAVEGFILLGCGFIFRLLAVRREAYLLLMVAYGRSFLTFDSIYSYWESTLFTMGFFHLLMMGAILVGVILAWKYNQSKLSDSEKVFSDVLREIFFIWLGTTLLLVSFYYFNVWTFNLAIVLVYFYLFVGNKYNLRLTELLGFVGMLFVAMGYLISMKETGSLHFYEQTIAGKLAAIEVFLSLYIFQAIYEKYWEKSDLMAFTRQLRKAFFLLLPIVWLPSAHRHFPEWFSVFAWLAVAICWGLSIWRKMVEQYVQLRIMVPLASLVLVYQLNWIGLIASMMVMWLGYSLLGGNERSVVRKSPYRALFSFTWLLTAWVILLGMIHLWSIEGVIPGLALSGLFLTIVYDQRIFLPAARRIGHWVAGFRQLFFAMLVMIIFGSGVSGYGLIDELTNTSGFIFSLLSLFAILIMYGKELYSRISTFPAYLRGKSYMVEWGFFHLCLLAIYWGLLGELLGLPLGIVVTIMTLVHGVILLFHELNPNLRSLSKLSWWLFGIAFVKLIFFDFQHFDLWAKIVVSMIFGLVMLGGSRLFLRKLSAHHP